MCDVGWVLQTSPIGNSQIYTYVMNTYVCALVISHSDSCSELYFFVESFLALHFKCVSTEKTITYLVWFSKLYLLLAVCILIYVIVDCMLLLRFPNAISHSVVHK